MIYIVLSIHCIQKFQSKYQVFNTYFLFKAINFVFKFLGFRIFKREKGYQLKLSKKCVIKMKPLLNLQRNLVFK